MITLLLNTELKDNGVVTSNDVTKILGYMQANNP